MIGIFTGALVIAGRSPRADHARRGIRELSGFGRGNGPPRLDIKSLNYHLNIR
jgi:hypothetical protein